MAKMPVSVPGKPDVLTLWGDCAGVARRPTGGFWAKVRLRMEVVLPDGRRFIGGGDHVYVRVYPVARASPGRAPQGKNGRAAPAAGTAGSSRSSSGVGKKRRAPRG